MVVCRFCNDSSPRCAVYKTKLKKIRLVNVFNGVCVLADCCGKRVKPDRSSAEIFNHRFNHICVGGVESDFVNFDFFKRKLCDFFLNDAVAVNLTEITHSL